MTTRSKTTDWLTTRTSVPSSFEFTVNGKPVTIQADSHYPLLWALRDDLKLTGTKFGCGIGECAVCLVDVDGKPSHSCIPPVSLEIYGVYCALTVAVFWAALQMPH